MATFKKTILRSGVYNVNTPNGRKMTPVSSEYISKVCDTANAMIEKGMRIPAPFAHKDDEGIYPGPVRDIDSQEVDAKTKQKKRWSSDINGGFWDKFEVNEEGELVGYLDAPDSVAGKIGETVKETSVFVLPEWEDGEGDTWENALYHVAMVTNPVESNQDNFEKIEDSSDLALAMSFSMSDEISSSTDKIPETLSLLKDKMGITLPGDTNPDNFFDRFVTVLINMPVKEDDELTTPVKGSSVESSPVIMSQEQELNQDNLVEIQTQATSLLKQLVAQVKSNLQATINAMVEKGKIGKAYATETLVPQIEAISMSLDDLDESGNLPKTALEMSLDVLEANPSLVGETPAEKKPTGETPEETKEMGNEDDPLTEKQLAEVYATIGF